HLAQMQLRAKNLRAAKQAARDALAQAEKVGSKIGAGRVLAVLAQVLEASGDTHAALVHQAQAMDHLRKMGDRRSTAELLLSCARMTADLAPEVVRDEERSRRSQITARKALEVARELATEIGWEEGAKQARGPTGEGEGGGAPA